MSPIAAFEFTLLLLVAVLGLELLANVLRLPPAAALIAGGIVLAFVPGFSTVSLDPELVLAYFRDGNGASDGLRHAPGE